MGKKSDRGPARACPLCGADNSGRPASGYSRGEWIIKDCRACSFVYLENPPEYEELEEDFAWEKTHAEESARRRRKNPLLYGLGAALKEYKRQRRKRTRLHRLLDRLAVTGLVLEVGCGTGQYLKGLPEGCVPFGIEVSRKLAENASRVAEAEGGRVYNTNSLDGLSRFDDATVSCVLMSSYLEHEVSPKEVLAEARRVLRPGGLLVVKVPNYASLNRRVRGANWCGFRYPDHVNYFTPSSLERVVTGAGFSIERFSLAFRLPTSDNMWLVASRPAGS